MTDLEKYKPPTITYATLQEAASRFTALEDTCASLLRQKEAIQKDYDEVMRQRTPVYRMLADLVGHDDPSIGFLVDCARVVVCSNNGVQVVPIVKEAPVACDEGG